MKDGVYIHFPTIITPEKFYVLKEPITVRVSAKGDLICIETPYYRGVGADMFWLVRNMNRALVRHIENGNIKVEEVIDIKEGKRSEDGRDCD